MPNVDTSGTSGRQPSEDIAEITASSRNRLRGGSGPAFVDKTEKTPRTRTPEEEPARTLDQPGQPEPPPPEPPQEQTEQPEEVEEQEEEQPEEQPEDDDRPAGNATEEEWREFRLSQGYTEEELNDEDGEPLGRNALRDDLEDR